MYTRAIVALIALSLSGTAVSHPCPEGPIDYRQEMMDHMFRPCMLASARAAGLTDQMGETEAVNVLMAFQKDNLEKTVNDQLPLLEGKTREQRMLIYKMGKIVCIEGATK